MKAGTTVKYSVHKLQPLRDMWQGCGRPSEKRAREKDYLEAKARRGRVLGDRKFLVGRAVEVRWDDGRREELFDYLLEPVV